jgi:hypothetical protein
MPHDWITDRPPTEADADVDGDVRVPRRHGKDPAVCWWPQHYTLIVPGQPWWSEKAAERVEVEPVPAPALSFAVGQQWRRRDGVVVVIERIDSNHIWGRTHPFWAGGHSYTEKGACSASGELGHLWDLIELVSVPEPAPTPTRKVVQIAVGAELLLLCDDGTMWAMKTNGGPWTQLPAIPQPEA